MHQKNFFFILCLAATLFSSCSWYQEERNILDRAETLLNTRPDSALVLLDSIAHPRVISDAFYNRYVLIQVQAKDKCNLKISGDTAIFGVKNYYLSKKDKENTALATFYSGRVAHVQGRNDIAMLTYMEAEEYADRCDPPNLRLQALIQTWIGLLYFQKISPEESVIRFKNAILLFNKAGDYRNEALSYRCLGDAYLMKHNLKDSAFIAYNKGLSITIEQKDKKTESIILNSIGKTYYVRAKEYDKAIEYLRKSLALCEDEVLIVQGHLGLAEAFSRTNMNDSAIYYLNKAKEYNSKKKSVNIARIIEKRLSVIEESNKNYKKSLIHMKRYTLQLDTLVYSINERNVIDVENKYNYMRVKNENSQLYIERLVAIIIGLVLLIVAIALGFFIYWRTIKYREALLEAEQKTKDLQMLAESYDKKNLSMRNVVIEHFHVITKTAMIESYLREDERKIASKYLRKFHESVFGQETFSWDKTYITLNHMYDNLVDKLKEKHADMPDGEFKTCCLTYARLNNTEIAILVGLKLNTIQTKKYALRKRFVIKGYGSIVDFVRMDLGLREYDDDNKDKDKD